MTLASLGLSEQLLRAAAALGYDEPTPVQTAAIPAILDGRDVWASAKTGSGKTAAFVLPMLELLGRSRRRPGTAMNVRALILVPTRELAQQIGEVVHGFGRDLFARPKTVIAIGGVSINPQMMALRGGADIVIATPGRLLDLVEQNALRLDDVEILVLDEADRLLSLGFQEELGRVVAMLAPRQNLLFSATFPPPVRAFAEALLVDPVRVLVDQGEGLDDTVIEQRAILVDTGKRTLLLRHLLSAHGWSQVLVFVASHHAADHVVNKLGRADISAASLHGDLSQGARTQALADFKAGRIKVLVATDVAARGIDVAGLPAVVSYDLPRSAVDYLHRIGRTGRAGREGTAVSFVTADTSAHFDLIEKRHKLRLGRERVEGFEPTETAAPVLDPHGGIKGKRKSKKDKLREAAAQNGGTPKK